MTFHKENLDDTKRMTLTSNDNAIILTSVIENCVSYHRSCCGGWMVEEWGHWSLLWSPSSPAPLLVISLLYRDLPGRNINSYFCIPACILPSFDRSTKTFDFWFCWSSTIFRPNYLLKICKLIIKQVRKSVSTDALLFWYLILDPRRLVVKVWPLSVCVGEEGRWRRWGELGTTLGNYNFVTAWSTGGQQPLALLCPVWTKTLSSPPAQPWPGLAPWQGESVVTGQHCFSLSQGIYRLSLSQYSVGPHIAEITSSSGELI